MLLTQALNRWIRLSFTLHSSFRFSSLPPPLLHLFPFLSISSPLLCSFIYHKYSNHVSLNNFTFRALLSLQITSFLFCCLWKSFIRVIIYMWRSVHQCVYSMWINSLFRMCVCLISNLSCEWRSRSNPKLPSNPLLTRYEPPLFPPDHSSLSLSHPSPFIFHFLAVIKSFCSEVK